MVVYEEKGWLDVSGGRPRAEGHRMGATYIPCAKGGACEVVHGARGEKAGDYRRTDLPPPPRTGFSHGASASYIVPLVESRESSTSTAERLQEHSLILTFC